MQEPDFLCDLPKCTSCNNYRNNMPRTTKRVVKKVNPVLDEIGVDNATGIDVPLHLRGGSFQWNFQKRMPWYDKVTWVLTGVNVAILISLVIKNVWQIY